MNRMKKGFLAAVFAGSAALMPLRARAEDGFMRLMRDPHSTAATLSENYCGCGISVKFDKTDFAYLDSARRNILGKDTASYMSEETALRVMSEMHRLTINAVQARVRAAIANPASTVDDVKKAIGDYTLVIGGVEVAKGSFNALAEARREVMVDAARPASDAQVAEIVKAMQKRNSNTGLEALGWAVGAGVTIGGLLLRRRSI